MLLQAELSEILTTSIAKPKLSAVIIVHHMQYNHNTEFQMKNVPLQVYLNISKIMIFLKNKDAGI